MLVVPRLNRHELQRLRVCVCVCVVHHTSYIFAVARLITFMTVCTPHVLKVDLAFETPRTHCQLLSQPRASLQPRYDIARAPINFYTVYYTCHTHHLCGPGENHSANPERVVFIDTRSPIRCIGVFLECYAL